VAPQRRNECKSSARRNEVDGTFASPRLTTRRPPAIPAAARLALLHPKLHVDVVSDDKVHDLIEGCFMSPSVSAHRRT
jgi:hypothetical protein